MKIKRGRYYVGRVIKMGTLDQVKLMDAIVESRAVTLGKFDWTITDVQDGRNNELPYVFGMLSKSTKEGHVTVVDTDTKSQVDSVTENLLIASSPFIYLPDYSGIAYMHVWNAIQADIFPKRFKDIIEATYGNFFVDCSIEPVSDYRAFSAKLQGLEKITELKARVHPPNPLFGRLWKPLKEYIAKRNASEVSLREAREDENGLNTKLPEHIQGILENEHYEPKEDIDITDSAILMAADGYGMGKVSGHDGKEDIVIRTSDTQKSFLFSKEPDPDELAKDTNARFKRISKERDMGH